MKDYKLKQRNTVGGELEKKEKEKKEKVFDDQCAYGVVTTQTTSVKTSS
jgi:hypothetical protein